MKFEIYKDIIKELKIIIANTKFEGKTYCVGGCCRDQILGNEIKDIDIVVELPNGGIELANYLYDNKYLFGNIITYPVFGTAMFKLRKYPNIEIEAVHTRSEKYPDRNSRNPIQDYGTIKEDCLRRDLTINALYYNISTEEFLDICGKSLEDIENHIINTPCDPNLTYQDDPLRILRCVRFATRYNWNITKNVYKALKDNIYRLEIVTDERMTSEFDKIISDKNYFRGLCILNDIGAFKYLLSPFGYIKNKYHYPKFYDFLPNIMVSPLLNNKYIRIAMLLYSYPQYAELILSNRKYSNNDIKRIISIINITKEFCNKDINKSVIREIQYKCKSEVLFNDIVNALYIINPNINIYKYIDNTTNHYRYKLPINGNDIIDYLNIKPSSKVSLYLNKLIEISYNNPDITKNDCFKFIDNIKGEI